MAVGAACFLTFMAALNLCWLCSRGMSGALTAGTLNDKLDVNGTTFQAASTAAGYGGGSHEVYAAQSAPEQSRRTMLCCAMKLY